MATTQSILKTVKEACGIVPEYTAFDPQLIVDVNSAFSTLHQLGYGPAGGFAISGEDETWSMVIKSNRFNFLKQYIIMKVHVMFDPPASSIAMDALKTQIAEIEWRLNSELECYGEEDT